MMFIHRGYLVVTEDDYSGYCAKYYLLRQEHKAGRECHSAREAARLACEAIDGALPPEKPAPKKRRRASTSGAVWEA